MKGTLVVGILDIKSSYLGDVEMPLEEDGEVPDTLQWWITDAAAWRVKTFALDHDVHVYSITPPKPNMLEIAKANNQKHYGDALVAEHVLEFEDCADQAEVDRVCGSAGLEPRLDRELPGCVFWKPDSGEYRSRSSPDAAEPENAPDESRKEDGQ